MADGASVAKVPHRLPQFGYRRRASRHSRAAVHLLSDRRAPIDDGDRPSNLMKGRSLWQIFATARKTTWHVRICICNADGVRCLVSDDHVHEPVAISFANMLVSPNADFFLRTDKLGRDIFSRIVYSARTALLFGIYASVIGSTIGLVLGVDLAFFGSTLDFLF